MDDKVVSLHTPFSTEDTFLPQIIHIGRINPSENNDESFIDEMKFGCGF